MVNKRIFGRRGWLVSEMGFGAWAIGGRSYGEVDMSTGQLTLEKYLERGGNFIDTASSYGHSEELIGTVFKRRGGREHVYICSKSRGGGSGDDLNLIREHVELSLRRLQTDYIDLYYLHSPPEDANLMHKALDVYDKLKEEGKVRAVGASIKGPNVTKATQDMCRQYIESGRIDAIQLIYSIMRQANEQVFDLAAENGVALVARTAIESGFLSGKYKPGSDVLHKNGRDHRSRWSHEQIQEILEKVEQIKQSAVQPPFENLSQVALRFALMPDAVCTCIPGARTPEQVDSNMDAADLPVIEEERYQRLKAEYAGLEDLANIKF